MATTREVVAAIQDDCDFHHTCVEASMRLPGLILYLSDARPFTDGEYLLDCAVCPTLEPTMTQFCDSEKEADDFFALFTPLAVAGWEINRVQHYAELQERD